MREEHIFGEIDRTTTSLDNHVEELHRAILGAQRLIRSYDRAASQVLRDWDGGTIHGDSFEELRRVYERRQV